MKLLMKRSLPAFCLLLFGLILLPATLTAQSTETQAFVCPPCGCGNHDQVYTKPGECPACNMALVAKSEVTTRNRHVAILLFDGVQIIDYTAPYEIFGQARFEVFTVAERREPITTAMGMSVNPKYTFAEHPKPDIVLVPGGGVRPSLDNPRLLAWVRENASAAEYVLSVCNGALILAKAGLLDGLAATTFYGQLDDLRELAPNTRVVQDKRFVDNGKIITSAGLSAGIDASLRLVEKILGTARAQNLALHIEYRWQPEVEFARANFADYKYLRRLRMPDDLEATLLQTAGSDTKWEMAWRVVTDVPAPDVLARVDAMLEAEAGWKKRNDDLAKGRASSSWSFAGENSEPWRGTVTVTPDAGQENTCKVELAIAKAGS